MQKLLILSSLVCVAALADQAAAQYGAPIAGRKIPIDPLVGGNQGSLGVCRTNEAGVGERWWVSARAYQSGTITGPHKLYEINPNTTPPTLVATYNQPTTYSTTNAWGMRDLATDGQYIYGGQENAASGNKVFAFQLSSRTFTPAADITLLAPPLTVIRALGYDSVRDQFYTSNFGGSAWTFNRGGAFQGGVGYASGATSMYGAAYDAVEDRYHQFGQGGDSDPNPNRVVGVVISQFDPVNLVGLGTTNKTWGDLTVAYTVTAPGGIAGGMDTYVVNGKTFGLYLTQANIDTVYELAMDVNYGGACGPLNQIITEPWGIAVNGAPGAGNAAFRLGVRNGFANGIVITFLGLPGPAIPIGGIFGACSWNMQFAPMFNIGVGATDGSGTGSVPVPLTAVGGGWSATFEHIIVDATLTAAQTSPGGSFYIIQ